MSSSGGGGAFADRVEEHVGGLGEERVADPPVGELAGEAEVGRAERRDVDRDVRRRHQRADGAAFAAGQRQLVDLAVVVEPFAGGDGSDDLDRLAGAAHRPVEAHTVEEANLAWKAARPKFSFTLVMKTPSAAIVVSYSRTVASRGPTHRTREKKPGRPDHSIPSCRYSTFAMPRASLGRFCSTTRHTRLAPGLAATPITELLRLGREDLEKEFGGVVSFLEGASGSTHNVAPECQFPNASNA